MDKNTLFTGQPIFSQLLNLIPRFYIERHVRELQSDRYYKCFKSYDHLVTMLFAIFHKCTSIREVTTGMLACQNKLSHLGLKHSPRKSTISEANQNRSSEFFERLYNSLYKLHCKSLPDTQSKNNLISRLYIVDSTTISLFQEILKNAGRTPVNGKRKGGVKAHILINAEEDVPCLVRITAASAHDVPFLKELNLPAGSIVTFDKGYIDYAQYDLFTKRKITWVTRIRKGAVYETINERTMNAIQSGQGVISDHEIIIGHTSHKNITRTRARLIRFYDNEKDRYFDFLTNNFRMSALTIAMIYKRRWQIEVLFKRIKQNYPLRYFLGDNENAIRIQIWCALIADLLIKTIKRRIKRKWSFANLASMIRLHLMTYTQLLLFLENPEKCLLKQVRDHNKEPTLFDMGLSF